METLDTYRTKQIVISLPKPSTYSWIEYVLQKVVLDKITGKEVQLIDDYERFNKRADKEYLKTITYVDPVLGTTITTSVAGLSRAIKEAIIIMWSEENGEYKYIRQHDIIVKGDQEL